MKIYRSIIENYWVEILPLELTLEQINLIKSNTKHISETLGINREKIVEEPKLSELINFYNSILPELNETDSYKLLSISINENSKFSGILNCRVNGEHKQIKF